MDQLFAKAEITPEMLQKLGNGMKNLADTTSKISDISTAHVVTEEYIGSVKIMASINWSLIVLVNFSKENSKASLSSK